MFNLDGREIQRRHLEKTEKERLLREKAELQEL